MGANNATNNQASASGITGILPLVNGGTARSSFGSSVLRGNGSGSIQELVLTNGQLIIGSTGVAPNVTTPTNGTNVTWTTGAGTLKADLTGQVAIGNGGTQTSSAPNAGYTIMGTNTNTYAVGLPQGDANVNIVANNGSFGYQSGFGRFTSSPASDMKTTGAISIWTVAGTGITTFCPTGVIVAAIAVTGFSAVPSISVGTNSTNFDNILSITPLTGLNTAGTSLYIPLPTTPVSTVNLSSQIFVNVTTGATATTYTARIAILGLSF